MAVENTVESSEAMKQSRPVETLEEFKLRIAAIVRANPEEIPVPRGGR